MPRSVQVSNKLAMSGSCLGPPVAGNALSLSLLLNDNMKKVVECKEALKKAMNKKKVLLGNIRLLKAEKRPYRAEIDGLKPVLEESASKISSNNKGDVLYSVDAHYVEVTSQALSDLPT